LIRSPMMQNGLSPPIRSSLVADDRMVSMTAAVLRPGRRRAAA
jgi:hypothetical protein